MKIFITGIAGFLGSHLAKRLEKLGHEISGNDTLIGGELSNLDNKLTKVVLPAPDGEDKIIIIPSFSLGIKKIN